MLNKIIQININKGKSLSNMLIDYMINNNVKLAAINEPYQFNQQVPPLHSNYSTVSFVNSENNSNLSSNNDKIDSIYKDYFKLLNLTKEQLIPNQTTKLVPKAAILIEKSIQFLLDEEFTCENFVIVVLSSVVIVSCYLEPSYNNLYLLNQHLRNKLKDIKSNLIILSKIIDKYKNSPLLILI